MSYRVVYTLRSRHDLEKARLWIADKSGSSEIADRFVSKIIDACESLGDYPERFTIYPYSRKWRMMPCGNYLIFFQIKEGEVQVGRIRHGYRKPFRG